MLFMCVALRNMYFLFSFYVYMYGVYALCILVSYTQYVHAHDACRSVHSSASTRHTFVFSPPRPPSTISWRALTCRRHVAFKCLCVCMCVCVFVCVCD